MENNVIHRIFKTPGWDELVQTEQRIITAFSMSRLLHHIQSGQPFAFITAWRGSDPATGEPVPKEINKKNMTALTSDLSSLGVGYVWMRGAGQEEEGVSYEPSLFVIGINKEDAHALGNKYNQYAVLWGQEGEGIFLIESDGSEIVLDSSPTFDESRIDQYWSEWKGRAFAFPEKQSSYCFALPDNLISERVAWIKVRDRFYERYGVGRVQEALVRINNGESVSEVVESL